MQRISFRKPKENLEYHTSAHTKKTGQKFLITHAGKVNTMRINKRENVFAMFFLNFSSIMPIFFCFVMLVHTRCISTCIESVKCTLVQWKSLYGLISANLISFHLFCLVSSRQICEKFHCSPNYHKFSVRFNNCFFFVYIIIFLYIYANNIFLLPSCSHGINI